MKKSIVSIIFSILIILVFSTSAEAATTVKAKNYTTSSKYIIYSKEKVNYLGTKTFKYKQIPELGALYTFPYHEKLKKYSIEFKMRTYEVVGKDGLTKRVLAGEYGQYYDTERRVLPSKLKKNQVFYSTMRDGLTGKFMSKEKYIINYTNGKMKISGKTYKNIVKISLVDKKVKHVSYYAPGLGIVKSSYDDGGYYKTNSQVTKIVKVK